MALGRMKSANFFLPWPHSKALATDSRSVFFQSLATTSVPLHKRQVSLCHANIPSGVPGGYFRGRYLHPVVCCCSCSPGSGRRPADVKNRAGVGGQISHLRLCGLTNADALTISWALRGAKSNSSVSCLLNTLRFSSCSPATDRPHRSRNEALSPGGCNRDH